MGTYNALLNAYVNKGDVSKAEKVLSRMRADKVTPNMISYNTLLRGHLARQDFDKTEALLEEMESMGMTPNAATYNTLANGCINAGELDQAEKVFDDMVNNKVVHNEATLRTVMKLQEIRKQKRSNMLKTLASFFSPFFKFNDSKNLGVPGTEIR